MAKNYNKRKFTERNNSTDVEFELLKSENNQLKEDLRRLQNQYEAVVKQNKMLQGDFMGLIKMPVQIPVEPKIILGNPLDDYIKDESWRVAKC